jgi:putative addiction module component (TIGR02574 family)
MDSKEVLEQALRLKSEERFIVVEGLLRSLDEPDRELDALWAEEAELRLRAYRSGKLAGVPLEDVFQDEE